MPSFFGTVLCFAGTLGLVISAPFNPSLPTSLPATVPTPTSKCTEQVPSESPVKPEDDCFYRPPENFDWKAAKPGTVLKFRTAPGHPVDDYPAYNILYSTTDSNDKPTYAVTTVFVPKIISSPHALISYQHNYDSADLSLSPSHDIYTQSVSIPIVNEKIHVCRDFVRTYLERGWFVNVPDYEGPTAAFGAGHMAGYATLDSIRATMSRIYRLGMPKHYPIPPKILMYGYSGGALATNWAAVLHPVYAAELKISGAGVGGFFPDMTDTIKRLQGLYVPSLIQGLATMHVEARKPVLDFLNCTTWDDAKSKLQGINTETVEGLQYSADMAQNLLEDPEIMDVINKDVSFRGKGVPTIPMLFHRAELDTYSTVSDAKKLQEEYCNNRAVVYLHVENASPKVGGVSIGQIGMAHMWEAVAPNGNEECLDIAERHKKQITDYDMSGNNSVPLLLDDMLHRWQFPTRCINVTEPWSNGRYGNAASAWKPGESKPQKPHYRVV